jgi:CDP-diacylglycerol--glycerol-3-phosphate 3-phosphatidyltransferase
MARVLRESKLGRRYLQWVEAGPTALLHRTAFQPNHLTFSAFFFSVLVIPAFLHSFWLGGLTVLIAGALDTLDGALARQAGQTSTSGAFLDSVLDRTSDFCIYLGLWAALYLRAPHLFPGVTLLIFFCIQGTFLVSYARARGEGLGVSASVGLFGRAERLVTLGVGSIVNDLLRMVRPQIPWLEQQGFILGLLLLLALGVHLSALKRMVYVFRQLKAEGR